MEKQFKIIMRFTIITIITLLGNQTLNAQWQQTNLPSTHTVLALAGSGSNLFACTGGDGVFLSNDNGANWTPVNSGLTNDFVTSIAISGTYIFVGTGGGGVYYSTNNGTTWSPTGLDGQMVNCLCVIGTQIFAGTSENGVSVSNNNGVTWTTMNNGLPTHSVTTFAVIGTNIFAGTWDSGVYLSTNNAASWTAVNSGLPNIVYSLAIKGSSIIAGTEGNGVYLSTNNGGTWNPINTGLTTLAIYQSIVVLGSNIYAGNTSWGVFLSTNNGTNWEDVSDGLDLGGYGCYSLIKSGIYLVEGSGFAGTWRRPLSEITDVQAINNNPTSINSIYVSNHSLNFSYYTDSNELEYSVVSISGQIIQSGKLPNHSNYRISLNNISNGFYFLNLRDGENLLCKKFIVTE